MTVHNDSSSDCRIAYIEERFNSIFDKEKLESFLDGAGPDVVSVLSDKLANGKRVALIKVRSE